MKHSFSLAVICRVIATFFGVVTAFASLHLYNVYLTKEIYGTLAVATQLLIYLPLIGGGVGMVLGQQMLASKDPEETRRLAFYCQVLQSHVSLLALVAALVLMAVYSQTRLAHTSGLPMPLFFAIGLAGVVSFHCGGQLGIFSGLGRQIYSIILNGISSVTTLLILWLGFKEGLGPWSLPLATAVGIAILVPAARVLQLRIMPGLPYLTFKRGADFGARLKVLLPAAAHWLQSQFAIMLLFSVDLLLMGFFFGAGAVAVYSVISRVTGMSRQMINTLCDSMWPNLAAEHDPQRKIELMRKVDRLNAWITGGWFGAVVATIQPFLGWFMKADWVAGSTMVFVIVCRSIIMSLSAPHGYGLLGAGRFGDLARAVRTELIAVVILIPILSHFLGPISIPLAALLGTAGGSLWYMTYLYFKPAGHTVWHKELFAIYTRGIISAVIAFNVASATWYLAEKILHFAGWAALVAGGCGLAAALLTGTIAGIRRGGATIQPLGPWLKLPARW